MLEAYSNLAPERLLAVIRAQSEIAKMGLDLGQVMAFVADEVQQLTCSDGAIVELAEGDEMVYRAAAGMAQNQLGLRLDRSTSLSGLCVEKGEVLRCDDSETDPRVDREACRKVGLRSMVVAPLRHHERVVGVLKIASSRPQAFHNGDVKLLELMSDLIAAAMHHAARAADDDLYRRATHDELTGLPNRALFFDRLRQGLARAMRYSTQLAILNVDMDGLKPINDTHGHRAGDAAIRETGRRMAEISRKSDTVARLGGDEFAVILSPLDDREGAEHQRERIEAIINQPFAFEDRPLPLGASIGVAMYPSDGTTIDGLIEAADRAMYAVKRTRKSSR